MAKEIYTIPKMGNNNGFSFLKVRGLQSKTPKEAIASYKQIEGHLHIIEYTDRYEIHNDKYMSINGPMEYIKHGLLELFTMYCWDGILKAINIVGRRIPNDRVSGYSNGDSGSSNNK